MKGTDMSATNGQDTIYQMVTDTVMDALKRGVVPWRKQWTARGYLPTSMSTGKPYRGINNFLLNMSGYGSPYWGTFKKIRELGGMVRKGERSTVIVFWKRLVIADDRAQDGKKVIFMLRYYRVFNAEQADGLPGKFYPQQVAGQDVEHLTDADAAIAGYLANGGPKLVKRAGDEASYDWKGDQVTLPLDEQFNSAANRYDATFHELVHSTGAAKRLHRDQANLDTFDHFGGQQYAREELDAQMGAAMLNAVFGIDVQHENSAAYIANWLRALKNDHKLVIKAAGEAQKAADLILGTTFDDREDD
jgi:antirestriction protein ArdC